jgi:PKD repeat protein
MFGVSQLRSWLRRPARRRPEKPPARSRLLVEELEPRCLLSTALQPQLGSKNPPGGPGNVDVELAPYSPARGDGWAALVGPRMKQEDTRDGLILHSDSGWDGTFLVDLPTRGVYNVTVTLGDAKAHEQVALWAEGRLVASGLKTEADHYTHLTFQVPVTNGQLALHITARGGHPVEPKAGKKGPSSFVISGLDITCATSPLTVTAGPAQTAAEGTPVTFTGSVSGGTGPYSYAWNFGDGGTASGTLTPSYTYVNAGNYSATLTVTDAQGHSSQSSTTSAVRDVGPSASAGGPYSATTGTAVMFSGSATDPSPADTTSGFAYAWNFGDGTTGTGQSPSHAYAVPGSYTVTVTATELAGDRRSATATAAVSVATSTGADPLNKPVPGQSDFTYLGAFEMPKSADGTPTGSDTAYSTGGLALRYVNGQLHFFSTGHVYDGGPVYETNYPGLGSGSNVPQASVVHYWGDVYSGQRWVGTASGGSSALGSEVDTYGLYYDQAAGRLYWNYGDSYNIYYPNNPSMGYSTLDDATGVATGVGAWSLANRYEKFDRGGVTPIPQWFADRYTGGMTLGVGFGGYFSIISSGSFGPALAAIAPPDPSASPDRSALANVPLLGYPYTSGARGQRDPNYSSSYDTATGAIDPAHTPGTTDPTAWNPYNGTGYWTWSDIIYGAGAWVDTPALGGVLYIAKVGQGNVYYQNSTTNAQRGAYEWLVYDPADLAAVASGTKQQWQIQPKYIWSDANLPMPADASGWQGNGNNQVGGVAFDPTTNRLYVLVTGAWTDNPYEAYPEVFVYQVGPLTPQVSAASPAAGATGVSTTAVISVTFDRAMNATTITTGTFFVKDPGGNLVSTTVTYNAASDTATLTPNAPLAAGTTYTVTLDGGSSGVAVKDTLGDPLAATSTWSFTTGL